MKDLREERVCRSELRWKYYKRNRVVLIKRFDGYICNYVINRGQQCETVNVNKKVKKKRGG
jgi:hypothetical protein